MVEQNVFDLIKQIPMAEENMSVIKRLEGLGDTQIHRVNPNYIWFEFVWGFPKDQTPSISILISWFPEEQIVVISAYTLIDMKLWTKIAFCPEKEMCECQFENVDGKRRVSDPALFWKQLSFIIGQAETTSQKTGL